MANLRKYLIIFFVSFTFLSQAQNRVTFQLIHFPAKDSSEKIYLTGNFNHWVPDDNNYYLKNSNGRKEITLSLNSGHYEYKFTRGSWTKGETDMKGNPSGNRSVSIQGDTTILLTVDGWSDHFDHSLISKNHFTASENVHILDTAFYMPQLDRYRRLWIYLPADYAHSKKSYPALYMHDGQNLFDNSTSYSGEWGVDEFLDSMFQKGQQQVIVVGIDHGQEKRMNEYNPWEFQNFGEGRGDDYVDFLVKTLKPYIDENYRTRKSKKYTSIAGSSMGGLISLYAVLKYPNVYGSAGIFSPAFWTASGIDSAVIHQAKKVRSKLFLYAGGKEGDSMIPDMLRIEKEIKKHSKSLVKEVIDKDAKHNEAAWRKYFPVYYKWIYGK
ncbi:MAG: alpha/beta hydrolase-fold protein [Ginsengibacter sp.]